MTLKTAHCVFAVQALKEVLGEDCKFKSMQSDTIVFMDRRDGYSYELKAGLTALYCTRLHQQERLPHTDEMAQQMRQKLMPFYDKHRKSFEHIENEILQEEERARKRLGALKT